MWVHVCVCMIVCVFVYECVCVCVCASHADQYFKLLTNHTESLDLFRVINKFTVVFLKFNFYG